MSFKVQRLSNASLLPENLLARRNSQVSLNFDISSKQEIFYLKTVPIKNAKKQSFHEQKAFILDCLLTLMNIIIVIFTIMKNFQSIKRTTLIEDNNQLPEQQQIQTLYMLTFSILAVIFSFLKTICKIHIDQQINISQNQQLTYSSYISQIITKSIIYFIHPSNLLKQIYFTQNDPFMSLNKLLSCIVYLRIIMILAFLLKLTRFYGLRVKRMLDLYVGEQKDFDIFFSVKCFLKQNSLYSPFLIYIILFITLPLFLITIEAKFRQTYQQFSIISIYLQALYDMIITMATIGYGQYKHQYSIQKIIMVILIIIGSFTSSFLTLTFLNWFNLNQQQQKALRSIKRLNLKKQITDRNHEKVKTFVTAIFNYKKQIRQNQMKQSMKKSKLMQKPKIQNNQTQFYQECLRFKATLPYMKDQYLKYTKQQINDNRDTFKDTCSKNMIIFSQSMKMLTERTLLTNNLLQFFLMRKRNIKCSVKSFGQNISKVNSDFYNSNSSIRSRRRVDDSRQLYNLRMKIINQNKQQQQNNNQKSQQKIDDLNDYSQMSLSSKISGFNPRHNKKKLKKKIELQVSKKKVQISI